MERRGLEPDIVYAKNSEQHYSIKIHKTPLEDFLPDRKYSLVTAFNVLEHVLHPILFVEAMKEMLTDDGVLYIDVPGIDKMHTEIDRFFWKPHINTFSILSLSDLLERCGLKIIHIGYGTTGFLIAVAARQNVSNAINVHRVKSIVDSAC